MALAVVVDVTTAFNANNAFVQDMSGYDNAVVQFVNPSGTINITATNDDGGTTSVIGSPTHAANFQTVQATKLADGTAVTSVAADGLYRVGIVGQFVKFGGASAAATKVLVYLYKIS